MMNLTMQFFEIAKASGMTSREIGEYLGVNSSTVKRWRNGSHKAPKMASQALIFKIVQDKNPYFVYADHDEDLTNEITSHLESIKGIKHLKVIKLGNENIKDS